MRAAIQLGGERRVSLHREGDVVSAAVVLGGKRRGSLRVAVAL